VGGPAKGIERNDSMYQLKGELDASGVYLGEEVERFSAV
jgi:hypothetical protein